jgi:hypothetical protein
LTAANFSGGSATKGGYYTVATVVDNDTFTTTETLTTDANAGTLNVLIKGSHVRNPGVVSEIAKASYTIETGFTDVAKYFLTTGQRVGGFSASVEAGDIATASFTFKGRGAAKSTTSTLGNTGTYDVLGTTSQEVLNGTSNVGTIYKDGVAVSSAIQAITFEGDAGLRDQFAVGSKFPAGIGYGRMSVNGSLSVYFETFDFYDDFINHATVALSFGFTDVDNFAMRFSFPAIKLTQNDIAPGGIDQDVIEDMQWTAQRDPVLNTMMMVDRFSSVYPFAV